MDNLWIIVIFHSDGTHAKDPLVGKRCNAKLNLLICSSKNYKLIYVNGLRVSTFSAIFIFGRTIPWSITHYLSMSWKYYYFFFFNETFQNSICLALIITKICIVNLIILPIALKTISGDSLLRSVIWLCISAPSALSESGFRSFQRLVWSHFCQTFRHGTLPSSHWSWHLTILFAIGGTEHSNMCLSEAPHGNFWYSPPPSLASETKFTLFTNTSKPHNVNSYFINFMDIKTSKYCHNYGIIIKLPLRIYDEQCNNNMWW